MSLQLYLSLIIFPSITALGVALLSGYIVRRWYWSRGWVDDPQKSKHPKVVHTYPVPRGGGLVIFTALVCGIIATIGLSQHTIGIMLGAAILAAAGFYDDVKDTNPYLRLALGLLAAITVVASGIGIAYITNPLGPGVIQLNQPQLAFQFWGEIRTLWIVADIFALIWIVWSMNMMNWSKGLDGQLPGVVVIASFVVMLLSLRFTGDTTQWEVTKLASITAGAYAGFLYWNRYPQKMMAGYGAGSIAGYLLAVMSILSGAKLATLILVLCIPMIDAAYVIIRRLLQGKSPVWGDRSHFHHRLLDLGWSKPQIAYFYWSVTLLLGIIALYLNPQQKFFTIIAVILSFGGLLIWLRFLTTSSKRPGHANG